MSQNFEELYNKLKEEYESSKKDNDEICKEYESTIEMLSESVENFKKEKEILEQKLTKYEQEQKNFKKEKENLLNKNKDKIVDIQNLNKQNDRLSLEVKRLKEEKNLFDSKIVNLENDNEHYQNKLREFEALTEDLENQLESALEENITLQTEFETFKQSTGDQLIRKDEEIRDMKNDLINKDKFIQRIQRGKNQLLVKDLQKNFREGGTFQEKRRFTIHPGIAGGGTNNLIEFQKNYLGRFSSLLDDNSETSEKTDKKNKDNKNSNSNGNITTSIRKARNSLFSPGFNFGRLVKQKEEINKDKGDNNSNNNSAKKENKFISQTREKSNKSLLSNQSILSDKRLAEMQIDEKSEKSEISDDDKDKDKNKEKEFKGLKICQEKNFDYVSIGNNKVNNINNINNGAPLQFRILGNEKAILNTLQKLLERVRKRKERLNEKKNRDKNKKFK
jgi:hypothetical protein